MTMRAGDRAYMIVWDDGEPFLAAGTMRESAGKRKSLRPHFPDLDKASDANGSYSRDKREAVGLEIMRLAGHFGASLFSPHRDNPRPFALARVVAQLMRLLRKLERHHLA